jgi:hypothetical protein
MYYDDDYNDAKCADEKPAQHKNIQEETLNLLQKRRFSSDKAKRQQKLLLGRIGEQTTRFFASLDQRKTSWRIL